MEQEVLTPKYNQSASNSTLTIKSHDLDHPGSFQSNTSNTSSSSYQSLTLRTPDSHHSSHSSRESTSVNLDSRQHYSGNAGSRLRAETKLASSMYSSGGDILSSNNPTSSNR